MVTQQPGAPAKLCGRRICTANQMKWMCLAVILAGISALRWYSLS